MASAGDTLFVAFRNTANLLVYRSFDNGVTWQDSTVVDVSDNMDYPPTILYSAGRLHLVYELNLPDELFGYKIFYSQSVDKGLHWTERIPLSSVEIGPPFLDSQFPSAYADENGHIMAAWFDYQYGSMCGTTGDILARISTDNGISWLPESRLTYTRSGNASSCLILNNIIYVAWADSWPMGCNYPKIVLSNSEDWGVNWSQPEGITDTRQSADHYPFLIHSYGLDDTLIHCFYDVYDQSSGSDLYYVRNRPFITGIADTQIDAKNELKIGAYPNSFNSSTMITFENPEGVIAELEIYNILGQRIWSTILQGKEGGVIWDAKDKDGNGVSSGTYFVRATTALSNTCIKLMYLK